MNRLLGESLLFFDTEQKICYQSTSNLFHALMNQQNIKIQLKLKGKMNLKVNEIIAITNHYPKY